MGNGGAEDSRVTQDSQSSVSLPGALAGDGQRALLHRPSAARMPGGCRRGRTDGQTRSWGEGI